MFPIVKATEKSTQDHQESAWQLPAQTWFLPLPCLGWLTMVNLDCWSKLKTFWLLYFALHHLGALHRITEARAIAVIQLREGNVTRHLPLLSCLTKVDMEAVPYSLAGISTSFAVRSLNQTGVSFILCPLNNREMPRLGTKYILGKSSY